MRYLKANPQVCEEMGKRGRKLYEEKYNWGIMKQRLIEVYQDLLFENDAERGSDMIKLYRNSGGGASINH